MSDSDGHSPRYTKGMATRRQVLGAQYVDGAEAKKTDFDVPFQELITETAWGNLWSRDTWSHRDRSVVTLALLCAVGQWDEFALHIRATKNTGASRADIQELILHVAVYTGVPTANHAMKVAKQTFADMDAEEG